MRRWNFRRRSGKAVDGHGPHRRRADRRLARGTRAIRRALRPPFRRRVQVRGTPRRPRPGRRGGIGDAHTRLRAASRLPARSRRRAALALRHRVEPDPPRAPPLRPLPLGRRAGRKPRCGSAERDGGLAAADRGSRPRASGTASAPHSLRSATPIASSCCSSPGTSSTTRRRPTRSGCRSAQSAPSSTAPGRGSGNSWARAGEHRPTGTVRRRRCPRDRRAERTALLPPVGPRSDRCPQPRRKECAHERHRRRDPPRRPRLGRRLVLAAGLVSIASAASRARRASSRTT